jgi:hypothetical protein
VRDSHAICRQSLPLTGSSIALLVPDPVVPDHSTLSRWAEDNTGLHGPPPSTYDEKWPASLPFHSSS